MLKLEQSRNSNKLKLGQSQNTLKFLGLFFSAFGFINFYAYFEGIAHHYYAHVEIFYRAAMIV